MLLVPWVIICEPVELDLASEVVAGIVPEGSWDPQAAAEAVAGVWVARRLFIGVWVRAHSTAGLLPIHPPAQLHVVRVEARGQAHECGLLFLVNLCFWWLKHSHVGWLHPVQIFCRVKRGWEQSCSQSQLGLEGAMCICEGLKRVKEHNKTMSKYIQCDLESLFSFLFSPSACAMGAHYLLSFPSPSGDICPYFLAFICNVSYSEACSVIYQKNTSLSSFKVLLSTWLSNFLDGSGHSRVQWA